MKRNCLLRFAAPVVLLLVWINQSFAQVSKPDPLGNAPAFNAFVESCFALYGNTTAVKTRIAGLQLAVAGSTANFSAQNILTDLGDCKNLLTNLAPAISNLISLCGDASIKFKDEIGPNPFRILNAVKQLKTSLKALNESRGTITVLLSSIPGIKGMLKEKTGIDTTDKASNGGAVPVVIVTAEPEAVTTTTLTVENITYNTTQALMDTLRTNARVKSVTKTFSNNKAVFTVEHAGITDHLLDFIMQTEFGKKSDVQELSTGQIKLKVKSPA